MKKYLLFLVVAILFTSRTWACGVGVNDAQKQLDCLQKIYWGIGALQTSSANGINSTLMRETIKSSSSLATMEINSGSNLVLLVKDIVLSDYLYKIVVMFGVGYFVAHSVFKK